MAVRRNSYWKHQVEKGAIGMHAGKSFGFSKTIEVQINNDGRRQVFWALVRKPNLADGLLNQKGGSSFHNPSSATLDRWASKAISNKNGHVSQVSGSDAKWVRKRTQPS